MSENLVEKLPAPTNTYSDKKTADFYKLSKLDENNFSFSMMNEKSIFDVLENINDSKAPGFDNIPGNLLKDSHEVLSKPIADIFNLSIMLCKFPTKCKVAKIKPIFKKGSKLEAANYRPISLLPLISKVFE